MRISRQIGWGTEANLIYELIRQTERLSYLYGANQPGFRIPISKPLSLSTESNLYYEWLRSLCKFTAQVANCCSTTTTTSTTTEYHPTCACYFVVNNTTSDIPLEWTRCDNVIRTDTLASGQMQLICAKYDTISAPGATITGGDFDCSIQSCSDNTSCFCYRLENAATGGRAIEFNYVDCGGEAQFVGASPGVPAYICARFGSISASSGDARIYGGTTPCTNTNDCIPCVCYSVYNSNEPGPLSESVIVTWGGCNGNDYVITLPPGGVTEPFCAKFGTVTVDSPSGVISGGTSPCTTDGDCGTP